MKSTTRQANSHPSKLTAWVAGCNKIHPLIEQAAQDGCVSTGTLDDLASANGISLACTTNPLVVITPFPTPWHNKSQVENQEPRFERRVFQARIELEGGEHTAAGNSVLLYFSATDQRPAGLVKLVLPNGLELTYGEIVALGGDFYGIPNRPISDGATSEEKMTRFTDAYNTLAANPGAVAEAPRILNVMLKEISAVNAAVAAGLQPSFAYKVLGDTLSAEWNVITGGGSVFTPLYPLGRYLQLAEVNWDHFGQQAIDSYVAGHTVAMQQALLARNAPPSQQQRLLMQAYAMNAFADHFLSDVFSAGHDRVPRKEFYDGVTPTTVGALILRYMHDEDSNWGLHLVNSGGGLEWQAYGDKRYFDAVDLANKSLAESALQFSVDEVFTAFDSGNITPPQQMAAREMTPYPLGFARNPNNEQAAGNISPLFAVVDSQPVRRNDVNNLNDYSWTSNWVGLSTLVLLQNSYNPNPPQGYPQRPTTAPVVDPNGWQANQSVPPNWVSGAQVRYAVSFLTSLYESDPGPWCAYVTVANQAYPTLTGVPTGPAGTLSRKIYRQFRNGWYTYVGQLPDNSTTIFVDTLP